jgi:hypothetical protein
MSFKDALKEGNQSNPTLLLNFSGHQAYQTIEEPDDFPW